MAIRSESVGCSIFWKVLLKIIIDIYTYMCMCVCMCIFIGVAVEYTESAMISVNYLLYVSCQLPTCQVEKEIIIIISKTKIVSVLLLTSHSVASSWLLKITTEVTWGTEVTPTYQTDRRNTLFCRYATFTSARIYGWNLFLTAKRHNNCKISYE